MHGECIHECCPKGEECSPSEGDEHAVAEVLVSDLFLTQSLEKDCKSSRQDHETNVSFVPEKGKVGDHDKGMHSMHISKSQAMRAVVTSKSDESLHPVIRMGWKPLCNVTCNGMHGIFWGGHDRDVYVQCTSPPYAGLPLVDIAYGGCMMTCSHFERVAGRELSKKWKESIHVVEHHPHPSASQKTVQKITMYRWLKEQAEHEDCYGQSIVGKKIWVCWFADARFYQGTVLEYKKSSGKHVVQYTAGRVTEELHLPLEKLDMGQSEPQVPCSPHPVDPIQMPGPSKAIVQNPIWNQSSDVSLNIALDDLQHSPTCNAGLRGMVRTRTQMHDEDSSKMPKSPPPKRTVSPSEQLLKSMAETYINTPEEDLVQIPPPPGSADPNLQQVSLKWMHRIAMDLEREVQEAYTHMNTTVGDYSANPVTEFQVLLALATPDQRMGMFIALTESYSFHTDTCNMTIEECRRKLGYMIAVFVMKQYGK